MQALQPGPFEGGDHPSPVLPGVCPSCSSRRRFEIYSSGFDEFLQLQGGDGYGGSSSIGLRVPFLPTPALGGGGGGSSAFGSNSTPLDQRYLFLLASFNLAEGAKARIVGFRQLLTIGSKILPSPFSAGSVPAFVELEVTSASWPGFMDARSPSWHLRVIDPDQMPKTRLLGTAAQANMRNFSFRFSQGPALLYEQATTPTPLYVNLTAYTPPNRGRPWGTAINADLGTFYDLKTPWRTHGAWTSLDIPVQGPATVAFFASLRQTAPSTQFIVPSPTTLFVNGLAPEDQFVKNFAQGNAPMGFTFSGAQWWRVGGALVVELDK